MQRFREAHNRWTKSAIFLFPKKSIEYVKRELSHVHIRIGILEMVIEQVKNIRNPQTKDVKLRVEAHQCTD